MITGNREAVNITVVSVLLMACIFVIDIATPMGWAIWLIYLLPIFLTSNVLSRARLMLVTACCTALVIIGYVVSYGLAVDRVSLINRGLATATFWAAAFALSSRARALAGLAKAKDELEKRVNERTADLMLANEKLQEEAGRIRALEAEKAEILAMVSHDMKSPITAIMGYTELLSDGGQGKIDRETGEILQGINKSSRKLLGMVEDFVTVSKMETGGLKPSIATHDVSAVLSQLAGSYRVAASNKGINFSATLPPVLPRLACDRTLVDRAVSNLLQNAVNYTPKGGSVSLCAYVTERPWGGCLAVEVSDTGPGIPPEDTARVFEKYYRTSSSCNVKGSGLGLAVVKAVAEAHGGRVELDSVLGTGSVFRMLLPLTPSPAALPAA